MPNKCTKCATWRPRVISRYCQDPTFSADFSFSHELNIFFFKMPVGNELSDLNKYISKIESDFERDPADNETQRKMLVSLDSQILLGQKSVTGTENWLRELQKVVKKLTSIRDRIHQNCVDTQNSYHIKNLKYMREQPPPKYVEGTNIYVHLALYVEKYIKSYNFSKPEIAHCLYSFLKIVLTRRSVWNKCV